MTLARRYVLVAPLDDDVPGGQAWSAADTRLNTSVTVVFLTTSRPRTALKDLSRFRAVRHSGISRIQATGLYEDAVYAVLAPPPGISLDRVLTDHQVPVAAAAAVVAQAISVVRDVHQQGLVHGALRPAAIRVSTRGKVGITGWGIDHAMHGASHAPGTAGDDAVALARIFVACVTGRDVDTVTVDHLPDSLSSSQRTLCVAVVMGRPTTSLDDLARALDVRDTAATREFAHWKNFAPTPLILEALEAERAHTAAIALAAAAQIELALDLAPRAALAASAVEAAALVVRLDWLELRRTVAVMTAAAMPAVEDPDSSLVSLRAMVDAQNQEADQAIWESLVARLHRKWPDAPAITKTWEWASQQAHRRAQLNVGPLVISLFVTGMLVVGIMAAQSWREPFEPDFPRDVRPDQTYPAFTHPSVTYTPHSVTPSPSPEPEPEPE